MTTTMKLVDRGQPRRLTGQDILELTERRVTARAAWRVEEQRRLAEERAVWRRSGARRRRFWYGVVCVGAVGATAALVWSIKTETQAILALAGAVVLVIASIRYAR